MRLLADLHISPSTVIIALSGARTPSLVTIRLGSSRVPHVNDVLARLLPQIEDDVARGSVVTVEEATVRSRTLPIE